MQPTTPFHNLCNGEQAGGLLLQPYGQTLHSAVSDIGPSSLSQYTRDGYAISPELLNHNSRPHLSQLNTGLHGFGMSSSPPLDFNFPFPDEMSQWTTDFNGMVFPGTEFTNIFDEGTPEILVEPPPNPGAFLVSTQGLSSPFYSPHPSPQASPSSPFGSFTHEPSPSTPNFPSSPMGSSGYHSPSPYSAPHPLTPIQAQALIGVEPGSYMGSPSLPQVAEHNTNISGNNMFTYPQNDHILKLAPRSPRQAAWPQLPSPPQPAPMMHNPSLPSPSTDLGGFIPQIRYRPHTTSDRRRYVEEVQLEPEIRFELTQPQQIGIPLRDALTNRFMHLVGRDDLMFENRGPSISIRLEWSGYQSWSRQIPTRDFRSPPGPITRSKLAKNVAKSIDRFINEHKNVQYNNEDPRWRVGPGFIEIKDLILVELHHVSMGSWQAHLRLAHPLPATQ